MALIASVGTDDINYVWSNEQPTIFNNSDFNLSPDDELSLEQMAEQADHSNDFQFENNSVICIDQYSIHRVGEIIEGPRCFIKISFIAGLPASVAQKRNE